MNLLVNAVGIKHSGGAVVLLDFLQEALLHKKIDKVSILCSPRTARNFDLPFLERLNALEQVAAERSYLYRVTWSQFILPRLSESLSADAFICLVGIGVGSGSLKRTLFLQQSLPFSQENMSRLNKQQKARLKVMRLLMKRASQHADKVIVQTPTMRQWVSAAFQLTEEKFVVVKPAPPAPCNTNNCDPLTQMLQVPAGSRLLNVGSDSPHKNLSVLVNGMTNLRELLPDATLFLTLPVEHPYNQIPGVTCVGYLSGCRLWEAYEQSDVLVMSSLVETVGLSMLEALSVGTPVLAAQRPYANDICGEAALFFDPLSVSDFACQACRLLTDLTLRKGIIEQGKQIVAELKQQQPYRKMVDVAIGLNS